MPPRIKPLRDRKYLNSYRDASCCACGVRDGTVVGAHIRHGHGGGMGLKPGDDRTLPLCAKCHAEEGSGETAFWGRTYGLPPLHGVQMAITVARVRYLKWKEKQQ